MSEETGNLAKREKYSSFSLMRDFDKIFDDFRRGFGDLFLTRRIAMPTIRTPIMDIVDEGAKYSITAEIPGIPKDNINVEISKNKLEIKAEHKTEKEEKQEGYLRKERGHKSFYRQMILPEDVKGDGIDATIKDGILSITVPKKEPEPKKTIEIKESKQ